MRKLSGWEGSTARIKRKLNRESLWKTVGKYIKVVEGASPLFLYFLTAQQASTRINLTEQMH